MPDAPDVIIATEVWIPDLVEFVVLSEPVDGGPPARTVYESVDEALSAAEFACRLQTVKRARVSQACSGSLANLEPDGKGGVEYGD